MSEKKVYTPQDQEIIENIIQGHKGPNFDILYSRYKKKVMDKCYSMVKDREMAKDLTEDVFVKVFEKLPSFKGKSSFSSWLYSITYNHCIDYLRVKQKMHYPKWNEENVIPEIIDESSEVVNEIDYDKVMELLEEIHTEEKALILMKYQDNLSLKQIGNALRISEDAAKMRLKRAKTRLVYLYTQKYLSD